MVGINLSLQMNLVQLLMAPPNSTPPSTSATASSAVPAEAAPSPPTDFAQLLQGLSEPQAPAESALPELLAVVASLASSSNLLEGMEPPVAAAETAKDKKPAANQSPAEIDPMAALQALLGLAPQICQRPGEPPTSEESKTSEAQPHAASPSPGDALPELELETPEPDAPARPVLSLRDFDVRRFEFKTEMEIADVQPRLIRLVALPVLTQGQRQPHVLEPKTVKGSVDVVDSPLAAPSVFGGRHEAPLIQAAVPVQRVQVAIDPPPPPPVARQISMDVGDPESQVRVVIRERNGDLAVQFGAATERLRENLQNAAPLLAHELQRDNPHAVSLDFSRFGTATEGGHQSHQESRRKKALKSGAVFADVDETAYLTEDTPPAKSF